jgi:hypothetical protein
MNPRRFATLAAALCGTVFLAGWVIAAVAGLGMQGIKNTDKGLTEDHRAPPLGVDANPVDAPKATAVGKVGISKVDAGTAAAESGGRKQSRARCPILRKCSRPKHHPCRSRRRARLRKGKR